MGAVWFDAIKSDVFKTLPKACYQDLELAQPSRSLQHPVSPSQTTPAICLDTVKLPWTRTNLTYSIECRGEALSVFTELADTEKNILANPWDDKSLNINL